ncbi:hypothetical protein C5167_003252 [Papaver somniferum]|uniref:Uncharacterized protein n=1 Tax=Papaver somniferum TaxID=3469 RepID=A0A4Y7L0F5_PAPSO|nr:hypothetical protein C5167_003252 [Papaver somniferum]
MGKMGRNRRHSADFSLKGLGIGFRLSICKASWENIWKQLMKCCEFDLAWIDVMLKFWKYTELMLDHF